MNMLPLNVSAPLSLVLGAPRFTHPKLATLAESNGAIAAWQEVMRDDVKATLQGVTGHFAVGLCADDGRGFMAVDRFAVQTLCYRIDGGTLRFAARADELAGEGDIDPQAIFDYLYFHTIASPRTIYKNVFRLPPGHWATFQDGRLDVQAYWQPIFKTTSDRSFDSLKDEFRSLLRASVADELDGSKPACFLSGGTDSSTVAGMAVEATNKPVASYSIGFEAQGYDEMEFARLAASHFKTEHHEYYVTPADLVRSIPSVASYYDQPFGNSSVLPAYYCAKMAREDGVTKLLAGDGGDELYGGNSRYAKQRVFGWYGHIPELLRRNVMEPMLANKAAAAFPPTRKAGSYIEQARVPMPDRLQMYNLIMRLGTSEVLTPEFLALVDTNAPLRLQQSVWQAAGACSHLNKELAFDWRFTLAECDLPKVRGATELAGVAVGFPLLDDRLLAFSLRLPDHYKLKGMKLRWFFKEALRGFLPEQIIRKKKQGFGLPFGVWANQTPALKALARDSLHALAKRGIVRRDFIDTLIEHRLPEHPGYFGEMVWILMMLEQWLAAKAPAYRVD